MLGITIGVVLAWVIHRTTMPGRRLFELLIAIPYPLGPLVGALAWSQLGAPRDGLINRVFSSLTGADFPLINIYSPLGIIFVEAIFEAPVAVLIIGAAMQRMDPALEECSSIFGSGKLRTAWKVTLPLMLPAILSAALFMFTSMIGSFAIPTMLGASSRFYVATNAMYILMQGYPPNYPLAAALGLVLIAMTAVAVWLVQRVLRGRSLRRDLRKELSAASGRHGMADLGAVRFYLRLRSGVAGSSHGDIAACVLSDQQRDQFQFRRPGRCATTSM